MRPVRYGFVVMGAAIAAWGQLTAPQVVAKSLAARGGAAKFAAVTTMKFTGHLDLGGKAAALTVYAAANPSRIRIELRLPQGLLIQGFDGTTAWQVAPGAAAGATLPADQARSVRDQAINFVDLIADPGLKTELAGQGTLEGHTYAAVKFTLPTGDAFTQYFDTQTWLAFHEEYPGGAEAIADYRAVNGLLLPFRYISGPVGKPGTPLVRDTVTLNPALDPAIFRKP